MCYPRTIGSKRKTAATLSVYRSGRWSGRQYPIGQSSRNRWLAVDRLDFRHFRHVDPVGQESELSSGGGALSALMRLPGLACGLALAVRPAESIGCTVGQPARAENASGAIINL
jgi:hypothetical protein